MKPRDVVKLRLGKQQRELTWSEFCFRFVGSANTETIKCIAADLERLGHSTWTHTDPGSDTVHITFEGTTK
jgi:hypothetical protein